MAHIVVLQAFEELGVKPSIISGTSIGAVVGAGLAAGLSTREMKDAVEEIRSSRPGRFWHIYDNVELKFAIALFDPTMETGGLIKGEKFIHFLQTKMGNLLAAVRASYSMPGLFTPVKMGKDLLVDGGLMNPLPYDIIQPLCDITVAIDVAVHETARRSQMPRAQEVLFSAFQVLQNSVVREKLKQTQRHLSAGYPGEGGVEAKACVYTEGDGLKIDVLPFMRMNFLPPNGFSLKFF